MPSARHDPSSSRNWWSLPSSKLPSEKHPDTSKPSTMKFNTLASAIGFKSKKHPLLAIQEPPQTKAAAAVPPLSEHIQTRQYTNRPPSKSVSSTIQSWEDSIEPRTPSDSQRDPGVYRQSLLTLSDNDPFASRGIPLPHVLPHDPNRLSVYSNSSASDSFSKKNDASMRFNRSSYSSTSSTSQQDHALTGIGPPRKLSSKKSQKSLHRKSSLIFSEEGLSSCEGVQGAPTISKSGSLSTLTDKHRLSQPDLASSRRPPMRARGLTDGEASLARPPFFVTESNISAPSPSSPSSPKKLTRKPSSSQGLPSAATRSQPRVIVRQASMSRVGLPPSAPPVHDLPPPPSARGTSRAVNKDNVAPNKNGNSSPSNTSFSSSIFSARDSLSNQSYDPRIREKRSSERTFFMVNVGDRKRTESNVASTSLIPHSPPSSPRTLKKAISHQTLAKRSSTASSNLNPSTSPDGPLNSEKAPRKQRSFHHPRLPMPSIPILPHRSTTSQLPTASVDNAPPSDQRRTSANGSTTVRKRLFSGSSSRRPSTSQGSPYDDDTRSVFSLPPEHERPQTASFATSMASKLSSSWDDPSDAPPHSPTGTTHEYTPQQIMSPADMLKLEASMQQEQASARPRGQSITSIAPSTSEKTDQSHLSTSALSSLASNKAWADITRLQALPIRSASVLSKGSSAARLSTRPSTSQATMSEPLSLASSPSPSSPDTVFTGLSPPPRPQLRLAMNSLTESVGRSSPSSFTPLAPPPSRRNLLASVVDPKTLRRHSLMRKPSFLEIDDDVVATKSKTAAITSSFLDLNRDSLDTVRSLNE